jgi:N-acetylglucosaminyldiphosphoundecaprenol N-acetyl-beta-D-mannosaminyltransferase
MEPQIREIELLGMSLARLGRTELLDVMFGRLAEGHGGWVITANLDFLRRFVTDPEARGLYKSADLRVADGMPLVWAASLRGDPLPERVPGSSLVWLIAERAAKEGRSLYLLGGDPGAAEGAEREFKKRWPDIRIIGRSSPWVACPPTAEEVEKLAAELTPLDPDIVLVAFGSPKQEFIIRALRQRFPRTWMMGVGISFSFVAGQLKRAPVWMRRAGLEWVHRLAQDPRRLFARYVLHDVPFSVRLFADAIRTGRARKSTHP